MRALFPDWRAPGLSVCLHERPGGFAFNRDSMLGLASKARAAGASIEEGVEVTGFELDESGAVTVVRDLDRADRGRSRWWSPSGRGSPSLWSMLGLPRATGGRRRRAARCGPTGTSRRARSTSTRACSSPRRQRSPRCCTWTATRRCTPTTAQLVTDEQWGVYFKQDRHSVQGGAAPLPQGHEFEVDPYPTGSVEPGFPDLWCAALSHCMERFEGSRPRYRQVRSGGVGAFTADNFPVFDHMRPNVFVAADSNHGYKMIAVGREIARVLGGEHSALLHPFRYERFATGDLHPVSNSPYPWSCPWSTSSSAAG